MGDEIDRMNEYQQPNPYPAPPATLRLFDRVFFALLVGAAIGLLILKVGHA